MLIMASQISSEPLQNSVLYTKIEAVLKKISSIKKYLPVVSGD